MELILHLQKLLNIEESVDDKKDGYVVFSPDFSPADGTGMFPRPKLTIDPTLWKELGFPTSLTLNIEAEVRQADRSMTT